MRLANKVAIITGAGSGIGRASAMLFAKEGARVVVADIDDKGGNETVVAIHRVAGDASVFVHTDVSVASEAENLIETAMDSYGKIDILFNNAGFGSIDFLEDLDPERDISTQVQVNLTGLMLVTRAVLPHMIAQGEGHIINMASVSAWIPAPTYTVYSATKAGVRAFSNALRREVRQHNIKVSALYPAPSKTEFNWSVSRNHRKPRWFKYIFIPSEIISQRVVDLAERPRRSVTIPFWFRLIGIFDQVFPGVMDWFVKMLYTKQIKRLE